MEIKEISRIENKRRFVCEFDFHNTELGISFLETEGLYDDIGVIGNFGPIRKKDKNYIWGNFELNNRESMIFSSRLKKNKTEIVDLIVNFRDTTFSFFQQYPQYTCIVYKPLSYDQKVLYDELLNGGWIDQFSLDIQEYEGFNYVYSKAFGSKKEEITKEDLFRVQRGDIRVKMFSEYKKVSDEDLPNFFKRIEKIEKEMEFPIFEDINWE